MVQLCRGGLRLPGQSVLRQKIGCRMLFTVPILNAHLDKLKNMDAYSDIRDIRDFERHYKKRIRKKLYEAIFKGILAILQLGNNIYHPEIEKIKKIVSAIKRNSFSFLPVSPPLLLLSLPLPLFFTPLTFLSLPFLHSIFSFLTIFFYNPFTSIHLHSL